MIEIVALEKQPYPDARNEKENYQRVAEFPPAEKRW